MLLKFTRANTKDDRSVYINTDKIIGLSSYYKNDNWTEILCDDRLNIVVTENLTQVLTALGETYVYKDKRLPR